MSRFFNILVLPFFFASCAIEGENKDDDGKKEQEKIGKKIEQVSEEPALPPPLPPKPDPGMELADPVTTNELLTDDKKKTVVESNLVKVDPPEIDDNQIIRIQPPGTPPAVPPAAE